LFTGVKIIPACVPPLFVDCENLSAIAETCGEAPVKKAQLRSIPLLFCTRIPE
jgi:hypothetical protein